MDHRRLLILDTGPIRELVTYRAVNELGFNRMRDELKHFIDQRSYGNFSSFFLPFRAEPRARRW